MTDRYVKDILEKLEEIEKLHLKLRTLVPRVSNYEAEINVTTTVKNFNIERNKENERRIGEEKCFLHQIPGALRNLCKTGKTNIKKLFALFGGDSGESTKFSEEKWKKMKRNSVDFAKKQFQDKKDKIKDFLSTVMEPDIILVSRGVQTSATDIKSSISNKEKRESHSKSEELPKKKRSTVQEQLERILEHFNYSHDVANKKRVSTHVHSLGKDEPRMVPKISLFPDEQTETLKIVSSAEKVPINSKKNSLVNGRTRESLKKRPST